MIGGKISSGSLKASRFSIVNLRKYFVKLLKNGVDGSLRVLTCRRSDSHWPSPDPARRKPWPARGLAVPDRALTGPAAGPGLAELTVLDRALTWPATGFGLGEL